ncbi:cell wall-associated NlpC family hydrolase [Flavobacterium araucananum]|uniref:Glycoside hydrolase n=1 Tax=Flavobacterium araucananum TaxID=946678 RepID=A0A227NRQ9_9FLAO|nr:peptidoglycan endopeptidase [Flavobacterium araucananum]OXE99578.1 glycoside hydrolase [Flavobacterium araucananum]PWJ96356.1 cell wall-associated NlpC family hydrolase [Flavobacterium araucananum]
MVVRLIIVLFFFSVGVFSQEKFIKHKISKGDNLTVIAKKYGVKAKDIQEANPDAPKILKLNSVLLIPNKNKTVATKSTETVANVTPSQIITPGAHEVLAKETLWGISKKYNVSVDDLKKANPLLETEGLKIGQQINIPSNTIASSATVTEKVPAPVIENEETPTDVEVVVEVLPKETKYSIAKKYGITVKELEKQNPFIKGKLPVGYVLKIHTTKEKADAIAALKVTPETNDILATPSQVVENSEIKKDSTSVFRVSNHSDLVNQLIMNATDNIGTRYRSGGTTKAGFDCSGLMICTFNNFDIKLPRSSIEQSRIGTKVDTEEAQKGDLIFFKTNGRRQINHVGMVVEVVGGEIKFVHSSTHGGVMISSTKEPYYQRTFSQVNRILQ